jgi:hypothetical protein
LPSLKQTLLGLCALTLWSLPVMAQAAAAKPAAEASPEASPVAIPSKSASKTESAATRRASIPPEKAQPIRVPRFDKAPVIDGKLDDEVWKQGAVFKDFLQTNPGDNIAPSKPTEVTIGYDAKTLYLAFHCYDEPDKIRATVAKRDEVFGEDNVRVFLDTFNDQRRAYLLGWNPLGVQQDGIMTESSGTDFSVDIVMESKGMITSDGWTLEVTKPARASSGGFTSGETSIASTTRLIPGCRTRATYRRCLARKDT